MKQTKLLNILAKVKSFPSMPGAAEKLLKLLDNPDTTTAQIEQILRYDPGLTANLLKLTNSVYFGLPCKVGSVSQAVVLLGWKKLIQLVMASCVNAIMGKPVPGYDLSAGELWRHSIAVSVAAEDLAKELKISAPENIFTAALLHDIGKLVLGSFVKEDLEKIEIEASHGISFEVAEHMVLGTNHTEIGAQILKNWSFPPALVNAVRWHHDPDSAGETDTLIDIVHVANILCLMIGIGVGREGLCYKPSPLATKRLGLRTNDLEMVASRTLQYVDDLCDVFEAS